MLESQGFLKVERLFGIDDQPRKLCNSALIYINLWQEEAVKFPLKINILSNLD